MLRAYAPEVGLPGEINIIDSKDDRPARKVLRQWIKYTSSDEREELRELLKFVSGGNQLNFESSMIRLLDDIYNVYLTTLHDNGKGVCRWGKTFAFEKKLEMPDDDKRLQICCNLREFAQNMPDTLKDRINGLADYIADKKRGNITEPVKKLLENLNKNNSENWLFENCYPLAYTTKITIPNDAAQQLRYAYRYILKLQIEQCRKKTLAVKSLMQKFRMMQGIWRRLPCLQVR